MKNVNLYNQDGSLCLEAQTLLSCKPDDISMGEWKKKIKEFKVLLSIEDLKEFERLKTNSIAAKYRTENPDYYQSNKEKIKARNQANKEKIKAYKQAYYQSNKEKIKVCNTGRYSEKGREDAAGYRAKNKEKIKIKEAEKRKTPKYKLRKAVISAFERIKKDKPTNTLTLLGCSWEEAKAHIENLWQEGMSWENHGVYGWHIDHIRPVSSFTEEDMHLMNKIENLQPLWAKDNLKKSDNIS